MKKFLKIIFILALIALFVFAVYFVFFAKDTSEEGGVGSIVRDFFPFGQGVDTPSTPTDVGRRVVPTEPLSNGDLPRLRKIHADSVAGAVFLKEEASSSIRFIERVTGHIFETPLHEIGTDQLTVTTIPKLQNAHFLNDGENILLQYTKEGSGAVETLHAIFNELSGDLDVTPLEKNIGQITTSPDGDNFFYLITKNLESQAVIFNSSRQTQINNLPFTEIIPQWGSDDTITLTTKASGEAVGHSIFMNTDSSTQNTLSDIVGLTTLSNTDDSQILLSHGSARGVSLFIYDTESGESTELEVVTLPEKCVWSSSETLYCLVPQDMPLTLYPDSWYKGQVSFSDDLVRINTESGAVEILSFLFEEGGENIDGIRPELSSDQSHLYFINKKDSHLWTYRLKDLEKEEE